PLAEGLGGQLYIRRSMLLAFIDLCIVFMFVLVRVLFFRDAESSSYFIFAFASTSWLRHVVMVSTSNSSHLRSLPSTLVYPVLGILAVSFVFPPLTLRLLLLGVVLIGIFVVFGMVFLESANAPLRKALKINGLDILRYFLVTTPEREETAKVESSFESISVPVNAHVGIVSFRTMDGVKLLMVVPAVHPGPFGIVGGSNLPSKLKMDLGQHAKTVFVPHGPCTHDLNPPTSLECRKISVKVKEMLDGMEYSSDVGAFARSTNHANVCVQSFGNSALILVSLSPNPTDDLDFSTGYAIREAVKSYGFDDSVVIDSHNCLSPGSGLVYFGSQKSMDIIETAKHSAKAALAEKGKEPKLGVAESGRLNIASVGPMGIQVFVLEVNGQKTAYILLDGNNMATGFREEILDGLGDIVDEAEVMTTDNHIANLSYGSYNPIGLHGREALTKMTRWLVKKAVDDLEAVEVGFKTDFIENFKVFG
ncbi:MAG: DUF2070 family protein, partial [Thermoplasmata archaeon]|nr:DUF2070 family protein [Thermoplasmata archaeon]